MDADGRRRFAGAMKLPAPTLAIASMALVQLGSALSTHLFDGGDAGRVGLAAAGRSPGWCCWR